MAKSFNLSKALLPHSAYTYTVKEFEELLAKVRVENRKVLPPEIGVRELFDMVHKEGWLREMRDGTFWLTVSVATKSIPYKDALLWAQKYDSQLRADDPRFRRAATVIHEEGTVLSFQNAFAVRRWAKNDPYVYIFTEHHRFHVYDWDDVAVIEYGERRNKLDRV